jgi:predicted amidohydrolase
MLAGMLICMDVEYPEAVRTLTLSGVELLVVSSCLPQGPMSTLLPTAMLPTRAQENHVFIAYSNVKGKLCPPPRDPNPARIIADGLEFVGNGCSGFYGPDGSCLDATRVPSQSLADVDFLLLPLVDKDTFSWAEARNPYLRLRRPELYKCD